jgi:hypothetical protein
LNENYAIAELKKYLLEHGYEFVSECSTIMQGNDLVMKKDEREIWVEVKGKTSSRVGSNRYGKEFTDAQCHDHFSRAFFQACRMRDKAIKLGKKVDVAIAFSHTKHYQKYCDRSEITRRELAIKLFWIKGKGDIEEC